MYLTCHRARKTQTNFRLPSQHGCQRGAEQLSPDPLLALGDQSTHDHTVNVGSVGADVSTNAQSPVDGALENEKKKKKTVPAIFLPICVI